MPDSNLPRWARILGRLLCGATYALAVVLAAADTWLASPTIVAVFSPGEISLVASVTAAMGALGLLAVAAHRWRCEWIAASFLAFALLARATPVWASIGTHPVRLAAAAGMTIAAIGVGRRALDLWVFAVKTGAAASHARKRARQA